MPVKAVLSVLAVAAVALLVLLARGRGEAAPGDPARPAQAPLPDDTSVGLDRRVRELNLRNVTLEQAIEALREVVPVPVVVRWDVMADVGIHRDQVVDVRLHDVSLASALKAVLLQCGGKVRVRLGYAPGDGVVTVSTEDDLSRDAFVRVYDVRDLVFDLYWPPTPVVPNTYALTAEDVQEILSSRACIFETPKVGDIRYDGPTPEERMADFASGMEALVAAQWPGGAVHGWSGRLVVTHSVGGHRQVQEVLRGLREDLRRGASERAVPRAGGRQAAAP